MTTQHKAPMAKDFAAHVALIRQQDGATDNDARMRAWTEGPKGYDRRAALQTA